MKTSQNIICTEIKRRTKKGKPVVYWRERNGNRTIACEKYWGNVPTGKLDRLLHLINNPSRRNRVRICKMVELQIDDLPQSHLKNTVFLKREAIAKLRLKEKAKLAGVFDKRKKANRNQQRKHPHEPIMDFISSVIDVDTESVELLEEHPMERWKRFNVVSFFNNSKRIHDLHEAAKRLLVKDD